VDGSRVVSIVVGFAGWIPSAVLEITLQKQSQKRKPNQPQQQKQPQGQLPHLSRKKRGEDGAPETFLLNHLC